MTEEGRGRGPGRRRLLLTLTALGVPAVGVPAAVLATRDRPPRQAPPDGPHALGVSIGSAGPAAEGVPLERLVRDCADAVAIGASWVRFSLRAAHLVADWGGQGDPVTLDDGAVRGVHAVLDAAAARGLQVCLLFIDHYPDGDAPAALWRDRTRTWWERLATEFAPSAHMVQVFNEADGSHYRTHEALPDPPPRAYLEELAALVGEARDLVHASAPDVLVTTNLYGWPVSDRIERRWTGILEVLAPVQDLLTVDAYVDWAEDTADDLGGLPERVARLRDRFGLEVAIGEFGVPTCSGCATEQEQSDRLLRLVTALTAPASPVRAAFLYQLRDTSRQDEAESTFGIRDLDGTPKRADRALRRRAASG